MLRDRLEAAERLAERLADLRGRQPLVLGIPRGAVPMARRLAERLEGDLDVVLVRKLGAPGNPEYAIGAVSENGDVEVTEDGRWLVDDEYLRQAVEAELEVIRARRRSYTGARAPLDPAGRVVVVVDDGSATGSTMLSALHSVRQQRPAQLVAALGVAPADAVRRIEASADRVECLQVPELFFAVSQFFADFRQVSDAEVVAELTAARGLGGGPRRPPPERPHAR